MNNAPAILRSLIIYAVIVPLAVFIGYLLSNPLDYSSMAVYGLLALVLVFPLLMKWHYPILLFSWSATITLPFLKGAPNLWVAMVVLSLGISILERILLPNRHFIRVPQITWPSIFLIAVILFTAKMTGGFGLHAFGSDVYGGKKYIFQIIGILSFFAITARPIPPEKAKWYVGLFFLGQATCLVGDMYPITPSFLHFIYFVFPPSGAYSGAGSGIQIGVTRMGGVGNAGVAVCLCMLARYGVRGIFMGGKLWRIVLWIFCFGLVFLGGYRSAVLAVAGTFSIMFFMEGMHRTRLLLISILAGTLMVAVMAPLASHLPFTFQRSLAFLPLDISQEARGSAEDSNNWRLALWKSLWTQVPRHLLLGKGYAISTEDFQFMGSDSAFGSIDAGQQGLALSGDYHNGILSVLLPFGIWGLMGYVWFMVAGLWVLHSNWQYGVPAFRTVNALLFACCLLDFVSFATCMAGTWFSIGCGYWAGYVGLSIALNNGVCRKMYPVAAETPVGKPIRTFPRMRPGFQR